MIEISTALHEYEYRLTVQYKWWQRYIVPPQKLQHGHIIDMGSMFTFMQLSVQSEKTLLHQTIFMNYVTDNCRVCEVDCWQMKILRRWLALTQNCNYRVSLAILLQGRYIDTGNVVCSVGGIIIPVRNLLLRVLLYVPSTPLTTKSGSDCSSNTWLHLNDICKHLLCWGFQNIRRKVWMRWSPLDIVSSISFQI